MKICLLTHTFPRFPGDTAAPFMNGVCKGLVAAGNEVHVMTPWDSQFKCQETGSSYQIHTYQYVWPKRFHLLGYSRTLESDLHLRWWVYFLSPLMIIFGIWHLYRLVRKEKIDLINAHWILPNGFIAGVVHKLTGVPVVSTLPGSDVFMAEKVWFRPLARFAIRNSTAITSNSPQLLKDLAGLGVRIKKSQTIIYGVDESKFKSQKSKFKSLGSKFNYRDSNVVVLAVGRLVNKKGFHYLIEAMPKVVAQNPNARLLIIGEGDQREKLKDQISRLPSPPPDTPHESKRAGSGEAIGGQANLKLEEFIKMPGAVNYDELVHYYNLADIFVNPSIRDQAGNFDDQNVALVEAMACAKPVIATDFPGYRIVIENDMNGYLVKEKDVDDIADKILRIAADDELRHKMGQASRQRVLDYFTWDKIGEQYTRLFKSVLSTRRPSTKPSPRTVLGNPYQISYSRHQPEILDESDRLQKAQQILGVLKKHLQSKKLESLKLLDYGCSSGVITNFLTDHFAQTIGVDVDTSAIQEACKTYQKPNLKFIQTSDEHIPFEDASLDVVLCNQVYQFVKDPELMMSEIYRVLVPGGVCFFGARNKWAVMEPQYHLPFVHWLPKSWANFLVRITNRGEFYFANYQNYWQLKKLCQSFKIRDYTLKILQEPEKYDFASVVKYKKVVRFMPKVIIQTMLPFVPNFIWILEKGIKEIKGVNENE